MVGEIDGDTGRNTMNTQGKIEPIVEPNFYQIQHLLFSFTIFYFIEEEEGLRRSVASV